MCACELPKIFEKFGNDDEDDKFEDGVRRPLEGAPLKVG